MVPFLMVVAVLLLVLAAGIAAAEIHVRRALRDPESVWRDPATYGHPVVDDDFWILRGRWAPESERMDPRRIHPRLGWVQGHLTEANPLGLEAASSARLVRDGRPKILMGGDSYVAGATGPEDWIPTLVEADLDGVDVVHLGVGGYGPDQAHRLVEEMAEKVDNVQAIVFVQMIYSLDRAALRVRDYLRPAFTLGEQGELIPPSEPIDPDPIRAFRDSPLSFRSFFLRSLVAPDRETARSMFSRAIPINRALLDANVALAKRHGARLVHVILHDVLEIEEGDQRADFMVEECAARGIPCVEPRELLLRRLRETGRTPDHLYDAGHFLAEGNRLIADEITRVLREGLVENAPPGDSDARARRPGS